MQKEHGKWSTKKKIDLCYADPFFYKFSIITKIDLFKGYMDTSFVDEGT